MSKNKKGPDYSKVTPTLVKRVEKVLEEADKHTYSTLGVFSAYNTAYGLNDKPQTCSSCLRARVKLLRDWMKGYKAQLKDQTPPNPEYVQAYELQDGTGLYVEKDKEGAPLCYKDGVIVGDGEYTVKGEDGKDYAVLTLKDGLVVDSKYVQPKEVVIILLAGTGTAIELTPTNEAKTEGTVIYADETEVAPGTYDTSTGQVLEVLQDGTATIKEKKVEPQYTDPDAPGYVQPAEGVNRILLKEVGPVDITPSKEDPNKGIAVYANDGKFVVAGTYDTVNGEYVLAVQPGGKVTIKPKSVDKAE